MDPGVRDGWLRVPYDGSERAKIFMAATAVPTAPGTLPSADALSWTPAYLDWENGVRVAQVRPHKLATSGRVAVYLKVNDTVRAVGSATV